MGKKQQRQQQQMFDRMFGLLEKQIAASQQRSPYEEAWLNQFNKTQQFLDSKDYRNLPTGVNIDLLGQSENNRMRQMMMGRNDGQAAQGTMGRIGQTQKMLLNDQAARDWSGAYEQKVGDLMNRQLGISQAGQSAHSNRIGQGLSGYSSALGLIGQRPEVKGGFLSDLFKGLIPGAANAALSLI